MDGATSVQEVSISDSDANSSLSVANSPLPLNESTSQVEEQSIIGSESIADNSSSSGNLTVINNDDIDFSNESFDNNKTKTTIIISDKD